MDHLNDDLLTRHLDDELSSSELLAAERHIQSCEVCRSRMAAQRRLTGLVDDLFASLQPVFEEGERGELIRALARQQLEAEHAPAAKADPLGHNTERLLPRIKYRRRFEWAAAIAACLVAGVFYASQRQSASRADAHSAAVKTMPAGLSSFDVDGEKFWALPYSNPDLPVTSRVIQMQVPVGSLADAGIVVEPALNRTFQPDRAVLADVLLGLDGQPVGVHVVSVD